MINYSQLISQIIKEQQLIIGPIAIDQAKHVSGITINSIDDIRVKGDQIQILSNLVNEYAKLFGRASVEVCRDAIKEITPPIPDDQLPQILR